MFIKNLEDAEKFVQHQQSVGSDVRWDNYDIVIRQPDPIAFYKPTGSFKDSAWGFDYRFEISSDGVWEVPSKYVKYSQSSRN